MYWTFKWCNWLLITFVLFFLTRTLNRNPRIVWRTSSYWWPIPRATPIVHYWVLLRAFWFCFGNFLHILKDIIQFVESYGLHLMNMPGMLVALLAKIEIIGAFTRGAMVSSSNNRVHITLITSKSSMDRALVLYSLLKLLHAHWTNRANWLSIAKLLIGCPNKHWFGVHVCVTCTRLFADTFVHTFHLICITIAIWLTILFFFPWWSLLFFIYYFVKVDLWKHISTI